MTRKRIRFIMFCVVDDNKSLSRQKKRKRELISVKPERDETVIARDDDVTSVFAGLAISACRAFPSESTTSRQTESRYFADSIFRLANVEKAMLNNDLYDTAIPRGVANIRRLYPGMSVAKPAYTAKRRPSSSVIIIAVSVCKECFMLGP